MKVSVGRSIIASGLRVWQLTCTGVDAGRCTCWQDRHREACLLVGVDCGGSSIDDEEQPEELVAALHNDMLPHASADQGLTAPMGLVQ